MSVLLNRKTLTRQEEEFIVNMLTIKPVEKLPPRMKFYQEGKEAFPFFIAEKQDVRLPYAFGRLFLKSKASVDDFPNNKKDHHPINVTFTGELRPRQKKKVEKLDLFFEEYRTATFCAHTGFGKTRVANYYIAKFKLLTVVLVPGTQLMEQWPKAIAELLPNAQVGVVGEDYREELLDLDNLWGDIGDVTKASRHPDILICMPDRWQKIPEEVRKKVGFLIVDEAHMFCTTTRSVPLLQFEPKYILALTASPRRRDGTMGVIHSLCGLHQVKAKYLNPVTVWRFLTGLEFQTAKNVRNQTNWVGTLKRIVEDEERNEMLADFAEYLITVMGRKPLFMCERKYHVTDLLKKIGTRGLSCDSLMGNKNTYHDSQVLLAIMKKAGTGFDEQYACPEFNGIRIDTVVYCSSFKEINGLIQYGGRAFRDDNPLIVHFVDKNGIVEGHWREAQKYYKSGEYLKNVTIKTIKPEDIWEVVE